MVELKQTNIFARWLHRLKDRTALRHINARISRLSLGLVGDAKSLGGGLSEIRVHYGPGYRVYFTRRGNELIILLCGGDKSSQAKDIERAKALLRELDG